jgi:hypothetical protein
VVEAKGEGAQSGRVQAVVLEGAQGREPAEVDEAFAVTILDGLLRLVAEVPAYHQLYFRFSTWSFTNPTVCTFGRECFGRLKPNPLRLSISPEDSPFPSIIST